MDSKQNLESVPPKMLSRFSNGFGKLSGFIFILATVVLALSLLLVFVSVLFRYVLNRPFFWTEEVTATMLVFITFASIPYILRTGHHIKSDLFYARFSGKVKRVVDAVIYACATIFCAAISWQALDALETVYSLNLKIPSLLGTPLYVPYSFMFVGLALLGIEALLRLVEEVTRK